MPRIAHPRPGPTPGCLQRQPRRLRILFLWLLPPTAEHRSLLKHNSQEEQQEDVSPSLGRSDTAQPQNLLPRAEAAVVPVAMAVSLGVQSFAQAQKHTTKQEGEVEMGEEGLRYGAVAGLVRFDVSGCFLCLISRASVTFLSIIYRLPLIPIPKDQSVPKLLNYRCSYLKFSGVCEIRYIIKWASTHLHLLKNQRTDQTKHTWHATYTITANPHMAYFSSIPL